MDNLGKGVSGVPFRTKGVDVGGGKRQYSFNRNME